MQMYARILDGLVSLVFDPFPPVSLAAKTSLQLIGIDIVRYIPRTKEVAPRSQPSAAWSPAPQQSQVVGSTKSQESIFSSKRSFMRFPSLIRNSSVSSSFFSSSFTSRHRGQEQQRSSPHSSANSGGTNILHATDKRLQSGSLDSKSASPATDHGTPGGGMFRAQSQDTISCPEPVTAEMIGKLPKSAIYLNSCKHFTKPLWDARRQMESVCVQPSWAASSNSQFRTAERRREANESAERCRASRISRLSDAIDNMPLSGAGPATSMIFHPFDPVVCLASRRGEVSVWNCADKSLTTRFHLGSTMGGNAGVFGVRQPSPAQSMHILNEFDNPMLAVGTSDGCVRVWRDPFGPAATRLVTAWQAVPFHRQNLRDSETAVRAFQWQQHTGLFFAGGLDKRIHVWDVCKERNIENIDGGVPALISTIAASEGSGVSIVAGYDNGCVQHFDLRDPSRVASTIVPASGHSIVSASIVGSCSSARLTVGRKDGMLIEYDLRG